MSLVTFTQAAEICGHKSRSSLYRLRDDGRLAQYLRPGGPRGSQMLENEPPGLMPLAEHVVGS
ncbi:MAG: hypothetical protein ACKOPT_13755, partial [Cyanobium sp.]